MKPSLSVQGFTVPPQLGLWRFFNLCLLLLALPLAAPGQIDYATPYTFATLAGQPENCGTNDGTNSAAQFCGANGVAMDRAGNIYVGDFHNQRIRKVTPAGVVTTLAGSSYGYANGTNGTAQFNSPIGVAVDSATNIYVADLQNNAIRKVTPAGTNWVVTTLAGGSGGFSRDGTGGNLRNI